MGRVREEKRREEERRSEKRTSQKKEDAGGRKGRKVANHCIFPMICDSGGSKSRLAKAAGAKPSRQMRDEKYKKHAILGALLEVEMSKKDTLLWREAHFEVKLCKTHHVRSTFGSRKSARRCEHISMSVKNRRSRTTWTFRCRFVWQAQGIFAPCQK